VYTANNHEAGSTCASCVLHVGLCFLL